MNKEEAPAETVSMTIGCCSMILVFFAMLGFITIVVLVVNWMLHWIH